MTNNLRLKKLHKISLVICIYKIYFLLTLQLCGVLLKKEFYKKIISWVECIIITRQPYHCQIQSLCGL